MSRTDATTGDVKNYYENFLPISEAQQYALNYINANAWGVSASDFKELHDMYGLKDLASVVKDYYFESKYNDKEVNEFIDEYQNIYDTSIDVDFDFSDAIIGCAFEGLNLFKEMDTEKYYAPQSNYCAIECVNYIYNEIQVIEKIKNRLEDFDGFNIKELINRIKEGQPRCITNSKGSNLGHIFSKIKIMLNEEYDIEYNSEEMTKYFNRIVPKVYMFSKKENTFKIIEEFKDENKKTIKIDTKKSECPYIMLIFPIEKKMCHSIVWKNTTLPTEQDMKNFLIKVGTVKELRDYQKQLPIFPFNPKKIITSKDKDYNSEDPNQFGVWAYDLETYLVKTNVKKANKKNVDTGFLVPYVFGIKNVRELNSETEYMFIENEKENLIDKLFEYLDKVVTKKNYIFAHNGARFDNIYLKAVTNPDVKIIRAIKKGGTYKSITISTPSGKILNFKDTYLHTAMSLKESLISFKCKINKKEFNIAGWDFEDYKKYNKLILNSPINKVIKGKKTIKEILTKKEMEKFNSRKKTMKEVLPIEEYKKIYEKEKREPEIEDINYNYYKELCLIENREPNLDDYDYIDYLKFDVESLSELILKIQESYEEFGISILDKIGSPSAAWDLIIRNCFYMKDVYLAEDPVLLEFEKKSVYGGRVLRWKEKFDSKDELIEKEDKNGKKYFEEDKLISLDDNSLYPFAMAANKYPTGKREILTKNDINKINELLKYNNLDSIMKNQFKATNYIIEINFDTSNIQYPIIPIKNNKNNIIYQCGSDFDSVYNDVDIIEMLKDGYKINYIKRGFYFTKSEYIFKNLISELYETRKKLKLEGNAREIICKLIMNSAYGTQLLSIKNKTKYINNSDEEIKDGKRLKNGQIELEENLTNSESPHPIYIGSYVLSYSRQRMNYYINLIGREKIYYSDTDSLYVKYSDINQVILSKTHLGAVKNDYKEKYISEAYFVDLKRYLLKFSDGTYKAKCLGVNFKKATYDSNILSGKIDENIPKEFNEYEDFKNLFESLLKGDKKISLSSLEKWFRNRTNDVGTTIGIENEPFLLTNRSEFRGSIIDNIFYPVGFKKDEEKQTNNYKIDPSEEKQIIKIKKDLEFTVKSEKLYVINPLVYDFDLFYPLNNKQGIKSTIYYSKEKDLFLYKKNSSQKYIEMKKFGRSSIVELNEEEQENLKYVITIKESRNLSIQKKLENKEFYELLSVLTKTKYEKVQNYFETKFIDFPKEMKPEKIEEEKLTCKINQNKEEINNQITKNQKHIIKNIEIKQEKILKIDKKIENEKETIEKLKNEISLKDHIIDQQKKILQEIINKYEIELEEIRNNNKTNIKKLNVKNKETDKNIKIKNNNLNNILKEKENLIKIADKAQELINNKEKEIVESNKAFKIIKQFNNYVKDINKKDTIKRKKVKARVLNDFGKGNSPKYKSKEFITKEDDERLGID